MLLMPLLHHDIIFLQYLSQYSGKVSPSTVLHTRNEVLKMNRPDASPKNSILIYTTEDGLTKIDTTFDGDTVWLSIDQMAELFQRDKSTISRHIKNIFAEGELERDSVVAKFATTEFRLNSPSKKIFLICLDIVDLFL